MRRSAPHQHLPPAPAVAARWWPAGLSSEELHRRQSGDGCRGEAV